MYCKCEVRKALINIYICYILSSYPDNFSDKVIYLEGQTKGLLSWTTKQLT